MSAQLRRALLDYGPLLLFFGAQKLFDIYVATAVLIVSVFVALALSYGFERRLSTSSIVVAGLVLVFGGLTLILHDDTFIKVKLTIFYAFFGIVLLGGLYFKRLFLKYALVIAFELSEESWRTLTWRLGCYFLVLAAANEVVRRNFSTDVWVDFKLGLIGLTFLFMLAQTPLLLKHMPAENKGE
jgi:intracellular septation protein